MLFVVFVDFSHRNHAWIFSRCVLFLIGVGFVPVQNTAHERRNQVYASFCTCTRLREREQQGQVTVDTLFFQLLCRADTLPGRSQFDQDTIVADARIVVQFDQTFCFRDRRFGVVGETCVYFGRDTARNQFQDLETDVHGQFISSVHNLLRAVVALRFRPGHSLVNQFAILRDLCGVKDQRRVSCGILRLVQLHCRDISGVSYDSGELTKGGQFIRHDSVSLLTCPG